MKTTLLLSCATAGLLFAGCKSDSHGVAETPEPQIQGEQVILPPDSPQIASLMIEAATPCEPSAVQFNGRLTWDDSVTVRVFTPFGGRVMHIQAEPGQTVARGDRLASIASPDFNQSQADARKAISDEVLARRTLDRVKELFAHGASPRKDLDAAEADLARASVERTRAESRLAFFGAVAGTSDPAFELQAPLGGVVVEKNINPGQEVRPDQMLANAPQFFAPLFTITDPTHLWVLVDVEEGRLNALKPGQHLKLQTHSLPKESFDAEVDNISEYLDPATRSARVRATVDNSRRLLKAEMLVTVSAEGPTQGLAQVVERALYLKGERHYLFLQDERGKYTRREVTPGLQQRGHITIVNGLKPGEQVVTEGGLLLEQLLQSGQGS